MALEMTFKEVCDLLKKDDPSLIDKVDKLLSLAMLCSPIVLGPTALPLLGLLGAKNEITKNAKDIFHWLTKNEMESLVVKYDRRRLAYVLICYTAFFEALDLLMPKIHQEINLRALEKEHIAKHATIEVKKNRPQKAFAAKSK